MTCVVGSELLHPGALVIVFGHSLMSGHAHICNASRQFSKEVSRLYFLLSHTKETSHNTLLCMYVSSHGTWHV